MSPSNSVFAKIANNTEENLEIVVGIQDANENNPHVNVENETNKNLDEKIEHE